MNEELTIQELCDQTGLPRRTIHFYTQQGIIPPPQGSGLGARYQAEHLLKLKLIPVLRKQGLRLDEIREKFKVSRYSDLEISLKKYQSEVSEPRTAFPFSVQSQKLGHTYTAYALPLGMILMVPEDNDRTLQIQLQKILDAVQSKE